MDYVYLNPFRDRRNEHLQAERLKPVFTWSLAEKRLRVARLLWTKGSGPGLPDGGYSASFSFAFQLKRLFTWCGEDRSLPATRHHWRLYLPLVVFHYHRTYGGYQT